MISCDYYRNGSLKSLTDVSGKTLYYGYDINGRLETLKDEEGNTLTEYDYTAAGRIKEIRTSNGITTSYKYDSDGNISRLTIGNGTEEGLLYDAFMIYDLNGNRLGKTGQRYHYALTAGGNMDSVIDNEESFFYNERNELTQRRNLLSVTEYIYDGNGSLIREKEGGKGTGYRYDLLNRQTYVHLPDGREQENLYDGEGLRAGLIEYGKSTTFLFYNGEILAECDGESMPVRRHLSGLGLSRVEDISTGTSHAYHQDEQGSTAYVTDTTGETENLYSYDGFGNLLESKEGIQNRILYTGQQYDQETGQYYLRARYYNPVIGRFTQEDTYRGDGLNLYAYCGNNPVMYYDPSGHGMIDSIGAALGGCPVQTNASQKNTQAEKVNSEGVTNSKDKRLALGLSDYLDDFASDNNSHTWKGFSDPANWKEGVNKALFDPDMEIYVNLDGVDNPLLAAQRAASNRGGATDWELLQIKLTPSAWDRITWVQGGEIVSNPFG